MLLNPDGSKTAAMMRLVEIYKSGEYTAHNLFLGKEDVPIGLSSAHVWNMVHGRRRKVIRADYFEYLINTFLLSDQVLSSDPKVSSVDLLEGDSKSKFIPKKNKIERMPSNPKKAYKYQSTRSDRIDITADMVSLFSRERERTNISPGMLLKRAEAHPAGLTGKIILDWIDKRTKTAKPEHINFVKNEWQKYPDSPKFMKRKWLSQASKQFS